VESHGDVELNVNVAVLGAGAGAETSWISFRAVVLGTGGTEVSLSIEVALAGVFALEALKAIGIKESPEHASEE